jgi:hypothetical protein
MGFNIFSNMNSITSKKYVVPFSKLLKANFGDEGFYQFVLGSIFLLCFSG